MNQPYKTQGSRVYGEGTSYNLTNNVTATELCNKLNTLTTTIELYKNTNTQTAQINKQITQIQTTLQTLTHEIQTLTRIIKK